MLIILHSPQCLYTTVISIGFSDSRNRTRKKRYLFFAGLVLSACLIQLIFQAHLCNKYFVFLADVHANPKPFGQQRVCHTAAL